MSKRFFWLILLPLLISGCASINNKDRAYLSATSTPPLRIPPGLSSHAIQSDYPVSDHYYPGSPDVSLVPPGLMDKTS